MVHSSTKGATGDLNRLSGVDFLRATACMMVVIHHMVFRFDSSKGPEMVRPVLAYLGYGSFGVSIFFVLSGYLLARPFWLALQDGKPMPALRVYALRRIARIVPGFWLALTVTFLLSFTLLGATLDGQLVLRYVAGLLLVSDWHWVTLFPVEFNGPLWSIGFEITAYALLPLGMVGLFWLARRGTGLPGLLLAWCGVLAVTLTLHALIVAYLPIDDVERGWDHGIVGGAKAWMPNYNPIGFFGIFAVGSLFSGLQLMLRGRSWFFDALAVCGLLAAAWAVASYLGEGSEGFGWLSIPYAFPFLPLAVGLVLVGAPSSMLFGTIADNGLARYIARVSFGVYLWHFLIMVLMGRYLPRAFDTSLPDAWPVWLGSSALVIALSFAVATISFHMLEQPMIDRARKLEKRWYGPKAKRYQTSSGGVAGAVTSNGSSR